MVSIRDVAQHADVPIGTVSNYMNAPHRVAPETQKRIEKAINDLGYLRKGLSIIRCNWGCLF